MDFGNLLSRAWQITWKHKILWLFGILAGIGSGGGFNGNFGGGNFGGGGGPTPGVPTPTPGNPPTVPTLPPQFTDGSSVGILLVIGCCLLIVVIALFILGMIGRGGLIGGIRQADEQGHVTFSEAWGLGTHYFLRILGVNLLLVAPAFVFALIVAVIAIVTLGIGVLCVIPLLCIFIPVFIVLAIIVHFAQFAIVLEDMAVMDAFRRSWAVLKANLANIIIVGIILILIQVVASFVLLLPFFLVLVPTMIVAFAGGTGGQPNMAALAFGGLALCCLVPLAIVVGGILHTWVTGVWTLAYKQFIGRTPATPSAPSAPAPMIPA